MDSVILVNKKRGKTPLEAINSLRRTRKDLKNQKIAYAGRLDPMAEGLLVLLVGNEAKKRDYYQKLPKTYVFTALFGLETDSYDILGLLYSNNPMPSPPKLKMQLLAWEKQILGKFFQPYPPFSAARIRGKTLYWWARNNKLNEISIPSKAVEIFEVRLIDIGIVYTHELAEESIGKIKTVNGDFRQEEITEKWRMLSNGIELKTATFEVKCSSGTYIRSLVNDLGKYLGCGALAISIKRTQVGEFKL